MRTTWDIPDDIFKKAKLRAVHEGISLKEVITCALRREFVTSSEEAETRKTRAQSLFSKLDQAQNQQPVGRLNREELHERRLLR